MRPTDGMIFSVPRMQRVRAGREVGEAVVSAVPKTTASFWIRSGGRPTRWTIASSVRRGRRSTRGHRRRPAGRAERVEHSHPVEEAALDLPSSTAAAQGRASSAGAAWRTRTSSVIVVHLPSTRSSEMSTASAGMNADGTFRSWSARQRRSAASDASPSSSPDAPRLARTAAGNRLSIRRAGSGSASLLGAPPQAQLVADSQRPDLSRCEELR